MRERDWQQVVVEAAQYLGFAVYHTHDSRRSEPGFPDLTMVKGPRLIFAELKTERGRVRPAQQVWLDLLKETGAEVYTWRPSEWDSVEQILKG